MAVEPLVEAMRQYDGPLCTETSHYARQELDFEHTLDQWIALYEEVLALPCPQDAMGEAKATAEMLGKLGVPLFRTFELESAKDYLQHQVGRLHASEESLRRELGELGTVGENLQGQLKDLSARYSAKDLEVKRLRQERDKARQKAEQGVALKGLLALLWRHRVLRALAKALGVRKLP
jgi:hypothetical protein